MCMLPVTSIFDEKADGVLYEGLWVMQACEDFL